jgi:hypothetical protein
MQTPLYRPPSVYEPEEMEDAIKDIKLSLISRGLEVGCTGLLELGLLLGGYDKLWRVSGDILSTIGYADSKVRLDTYKVKLMIGLERNDIRNCLFRINITDP